MNYGSFAGHRPRMTPLPTARAGCGALFDDALSTLGLLYGHELEALWIDRLVIGIHFVGVKLSNDCGGVAYTPPELIRRGSNQILKRMNRRVRGMSAYVVARGMLDHPFAEVIRLATLNALSVPFMHEERYLVEPGGDLTAYRPLFEGRRVCMVGAIIPLLKKVKPLASQISVVDRKEDTESEAGGIRFVPAERTARALGSCDTAVFTGAAIANGTLQDLLSMVSPGTAVAVVGPSAGFVPNPLFARGVSMVGTSIVSDIDQALDILAEGGGAYQLFGECVRKTNFLNGPLLKELGLETSVVC